MVTIRPKTANLSVDSKLGEGTSCGAPDDPARLAVTPARADGRSPLSEGWSCGADDICRFASGTFANRLCRRSFAAYDILLGDFDGNGYRDVAGIDPRTCASYMDADQLFSHDLELNVDLITGPPRSGRSRRRSHR